jgi:hypothetical protein
MRAPDDKINIPGFSGVPEYSPVERACRRAGEAPQGSASRRSLHRRLAGLIRRRGDISSRDLRALVAYLKGEFDLKPNRPPYNAWERFGADSGARRRAASHRLANRCHDLNSCSCQLLLGCLDVL